MCVPLYHKNAELDQIWGPKHDFKKSYKAFGDFSEIVFKDLFYLTNPYIFKTSTENIWERPN